MSNKKETIADIVAEMRNESHAGDESCLEWVGAKMRTYADRIEAAAKREREAGAEAAQDVWRKEDGGKTAYYEWLLA